MSEDAKDVLQAVREELVAERDMTPREVMDEHMVGRVHSLEERVAALEDDNTPEPPQTPAERRTGQKLLDMVRPGWRERPSAAAEEGLTLDESIRVDKLRHATETGPPPNAGECRKLLALIERLRLAALRSSPADTQKASVGEGDRTWVRDRLTEVFQVGATTARTNRYPEDWRGTDGIADAIMARLCPAAAAPFAPPDRLAALRSVPAEPVAGERVSEIARFLGQMLDQYHESDGSTRWEGTAAWAIRAAALLRAMPEGTVGTGQPVGSLWAAAIALDEGSVDMGTTYRVQVEHMEALRLAYREPPPAPVGTAWSEAERDALRRAAREQVRIGNEFIMYSRSRPNAALDATYVRRVDALRSVLARLERGEAPTVESVECVFCRHPIPPEECDDEQSDGAPLSSSACALDDGRWVCSRDCWERAVRMWDEAPDNPTSTAERRLRETPEGDDAEPSEAVQVLRVCCGCFAVGEFDHHPDDVPDACVWCGEPWLVFSARPEPSKDTHTDLIARWQEREHPASAPPPPGGAEGETP